VNIKIRDYLISEADQILSALKLADPSARMQNTDTEGLVGEALLDKGLLDEAVEAYGDLAAREPNCGYELYFCLFDYVRKQKELFERVRPKVAASRSKAAPVMLSIPVWGEKYIRTMLAVQMPTMMSCKNLPAIAKNHEVVIEFATRSVDAHLIENSYWYRRLEELPNVTPGIARYPNELFTSHPKVPQYNYRLMGVMHHLSILRARAMGGMNVFLLCSDYIMSDSVMSKILDYVNTGYEMVLMPSVKIRSDSALSKVLLDLNSRETKPEIEIDSRRMSEIAVEFMHPEFRQLIVSTHTKPFSRLPFPLLFPHKDGYILRSFVLQPILVSTNLVEQEILYDFNTVDGVFLDRILAGRDPASAVKLIDDSDDGIMLDMADFITIKEGDVVQKFELSAVINWLFYWRRQGVEDIFKWLFAQRVILRSGRIEMQLDPDDLDEETTVAVLEHVISKFG